MVSPPELHPQCRRGAIYKLHDGLRLALLVGALFDIALGLLRASGEGFASSSSKQFSTLMDGLANDWAGFGDCLIFDLSGTISNLSYEKTPPALWLARRPPRETSPATTSTAEGHSWHGLV